jgi:hypothetical protein
MRSDVATGEKIPVAAHGAPTAPAASCGCWRDHRFTRRQKASSGGANRTAQLSIIGCLPGDGATARREGSDGARAHAEHLRGLLGREADVAGQEYGRALIRRELTERADEEIAVVDVRERVVARGDAERLAQTEHRAPVPVPEHVHRRPEQIRGRVGKLDLVPAFPHAEEGVLHDLLRLVTVAGHEAQGAEQTRVLLAEELFEQPRCLGHRRLHGLRVGGPERAFNHGAWTTGSIYEARVRTDGPSTRRGERRSPGSRVPRAIAVPQEHAPAPA